MAIERAVWIALRKRDGSQVRLYSLDFDDSFHFDAARLEKETVSWKEYVKAVAWALQTNGLHLNGWEGVIAGNVPIGSGLSSSAAFEIAMARAFAVANGSAWEPVKIAKLMQKAENDWIGVSSGIMDPFIIAVAQAGKAALIDCKNLDIQHVAIPPQAALVIMNTMKRRGLVGSAYNQRRQECDDAAKYFGVESLRDVDADELMHAKTKLPNNVFKRARHVISENDRVITMASCLEKDDLSASGKLMTESHISLRDDYEVSCKELDLMVEIALSQSGCLGARMTGAGFGGCAVALVEGDAAAEFERQVSTGYREKTGIQPEIIVSPPADGVKLLEIT
jgi:galactokinase